MQLAGEGSEKGTLVFLSDGHSESVKSVDAGLWLELRREQSAWRERVLKGIAWSLLATCGFTFAWYALVPNAIPELVVVMAVTLVGLLVAVLGARLPYVLRAGIVLAAPYVPSVASIALGGFGPNPFMGFCMMAVSGTLLFGRRTGLALLGFALLTIALVSFAHVSGLVIRNAHWVANLDSSKPAVALRVLMIFALLTTTIVVAVTYLLRRSEELALEKARSLATLQIEQRERERIARDLELREAAFQKARELELLGRLAGTMAHDFNNALLVVWSALDELSLASLPAHAQESVRDIRLAANQAAAATRQLRAFGPTTPRRASELALTPLIEKTHTMFSRVLPQNIRFLTDVSVDVVRLADEGELLRVLMNLALNARDAMRDGGELTLRVRLPRAGESPAAEAAAGFVAIDISDTGGGMSDEVKSRLFEPFFTTKQGSGTGLGLASVRTLLEAQGGAVSVTSELSRGTTITLMWPVATAATPRAEKPLPDSGGRAVVVLVVDDDEQVRQVLTRGLTRLGLTVLAASDGESGLVLARRFAGKIEVLCTDCVMAGVPVRKLIAGFRELHQGRVIVCSGYAPAETGLSQDDFDDFLAKPFSIAELTQRVRALSRMH
jgi:signal transduction histidine kinase